jgi:ABC-type sugar transport system substrate-binding protein
MGSARLFLACVIAIMALHSGPAAGAPQGKRIALLTTPNQNPYIGAWNGAFIATAEKRGMKVTNQTTPYDAAVQSQQVDDAIAQKFDLIVLIVANHQAIIPVLTRAKAAGIPVVFVVAPIEGHEDLFLSYIGTDHGELGRLAGENLARALTSGGRKGGNVAAITGFTPQYNTQLRMEGFKKAISSQPTVKLVAVEDGRWNTALSEKIAGQLLVRFAGQGGLAGMYGMADNQAAGIIQAIEAAGLKLGTAKDGIVVVGSNCMKEGIQNIRAGKQYSTNTQIPTQEGRAAAERIASHFDGKSLKKWEILPIEAITTKNVDRYAEACTY